MARIRSPHQVDPAEANRRLVLELVEALDEVEQDDGPVIFEVAVGTTDLIQVIVIWERWSDLSNTVRTRIVTTAYETLNEKHLGKSDLDNISMILPMTAEQAIESRILPYSVQCNVHKSEDQYPLLIPLLKREGAIVIGARTELRLPTSEMARAARDRLREATKDFDPEVRWQVAEDVGRIYDYS